MKKLALICLGVVIGFGGNLFDAFEGTAMAQARIARPPCEVCRGPQIFDPQGKLVDVYDESHALIIGVSNYTQGWRPIPDVENDIQAVQRVLHEQHGFEVEVVRNPKDKSALETAFNGFIERHGNNPENRLLFYFTGHGYTEKLPYSGSRMGYIVSADAPLPDLDKAGFLRNEVDFLSHAMKMKEIEDTARRIRAKHALFIFDSCFSGSIFELRSNVIPNIIADNTAFPVRQFITAGSADESVPFQSIFRPLFVKALNGEGDSDKDGYVTASELGAFLQASVIKASENMQHPQYGKIHDSDLNQGDFVFKLQVPTPSPTPIPSQTPTPTATPKIEKNDGHTFRNIAIGVGAAAAVGGIVALLANSNSNAEPTPTPTLPEFKIVDPQPNATVNQRYYLVRGVGMKEQAQNFSCAVFTNTSYPQTNAYQRNPDGSWETWVNLSGEGQYNNHAIRVEVLYRDGNREQAETSGIKVAE